MGTQVSYPWWHHAVIYQVYPRSFASTGGPLGNLTGVTSKLPYLRDLGVDAVWLSPFYPSPQRDGGYDVSDYQQVDPRFGSLADFDALVAAAHDLGIRIIVDLVPNHTSDAHPRFQAALAAGPGSRERQWYWFRDSDQIPNNWRSIFGGPAWTRVCDRPDAPGSAWADDQQWYLHLFDTSQPDLNWENPEVVAYFDQVLRFWLDRGVDGFRIDVAHGLAKDPSLPDWDGQLAMVEGEDDHHVDGKPDIPPPPMFDQEGVHQVYRRWNQLLSSYPGERLLVAEAWVASPRRLARYLRADEMHQAFNFDFLCCPWESAALRETISQSLNAFNEVGRPATWVLSNHDVIRHASRLGIGRGGKGPNGIRATDPQPDTDLGRRRARAATLLMLALPGSAYLYQGEELGLPEHTSLEDRWRQDPAFFRTAGAEAGRDGCRIPLPWEADRPAFGFSPDGESWLPQPPQWVSLAADRQRRDPESSLHLYRRALKLRREWELGQGQWQFVDCGDNAVAGINRCASGERLILTSLGPGVVLPLGWKVELCSDPQVHIEGGAQVPVDTTVWCRPNF